MNLWINGFLLLQRIIVHLITFIIRLCIQLHNRYHRVLIFVLYSSNKICYCLAFVLIWTRCSRRMFVFIIISFFFVTFNFLKNRFPNLSTVSFLLFFLSRRISDENVDYKWLENKKIKILYFNSYVLQKKKYTFSYRNIVYKV